MTISTSYKSKQFLWLVFKLIVLILLSYFIYDTLANNSEISWKEFQQTLKNSAVYDPLIILILPGFTMLNWTLEIFKWQLLVGTIKPASFSEAATQSLASHAFSLITPNRIGEYGAKALYYEKSERKNIVVLNLIGNFHQLIVTILLGLIGLLFLKSEIKEVVPDLHYDVLTGVIIAIVFLISIMRFVSGKFRLWLNGIHARFEFITTSLNAKISILCFLRYVVFAHQFYFLITFFELNIDYTTCMASISAMYLLSSIVPMLAVFDFVVKGSVAVFIFSVFNVSPPVILSITTIMWLLNFVFPAIVGSYFVVKFKPIAA